MAEVASELLLAPAADHLTASASDCPLKRYKPHALHLVCRAVDNCHTSSRTTIRRRPTNACLGIKG